MTTPPGRVDHPVELGRSKSAAFAPLSRRRLRQLSAALVSQHATSSADRQTSGYAFWYICDRLPTPTMQCGAVVPPGRRSRPARPTAAAKPGCRAGLGEVPSCHSADDGRSMTSIPLARTHSRPSCCRPLHTSARQMSTSRRPHALRLTDGRSRPRRGVPAARPVAARGGRPEPRAESPTQLTIPDGPDDPVQAADAHAAQTREAGP